MCLYRFDLGEKFGMKYKYQSATAVLFLVCCVLSVLLAMDNKQLREAAVKTYNDWSMYIQGAHSILQELGGDLSEIGEAYDAIKQARGIVVGVIGYPVPARETIGALSNLNFELDVEFDVLENHGHPAQDRAFLKAQLEMIVRRLPREVDSVDQLGKLRDQIDTLSKQLHDRFGGYLDPSNPAGGAPPS
jgi:hypothetical protein